MFVDQAKIQVKAGDGGNGCLAFRREKFVPRGGPSGGDGGWGGNVVFRSTVHQNTLLRFRYNQHFRAARGQHGSGSNRSGRAGRDLVVDVPVGTLVHDFESGDLLFDFDGPGLEMVVARGGRGGRGNAAFATSTNQAPRRFEEGRPGEEQWLRLELKVLADVGLIGYPNAGKSTLISAISAAKPKIADYPFTTLSPNLGVVEYRDLSTLVVADIPGLIEGAHSGGGLGDRFLRHVERTRLLVHLVDIGPTGPDDPARALVAINRELELYSPNLMEKPQLIAASKMDVADPARLSVLVNHCSANRLRLVQISAVAGSGLSDLIDLMARHVLKESRA